jgi:hypothetical protein
MPKYLTIHQENNVHRALLESRWTEISQDLRADWQMTLFNLHLGVRYCEWDASDPAIVEEIFREHGIKCAEIIEVEETSASKWRLWEVKTRESAINCWEFMKCGKEPREDRIKGKGDCCPIAENRYLWGRNRGLYAGRSCWKVPGTLCDGTVLASYAEKMRDCAQCNFFQQVKCEEASRFEP